MPKVNTPFLSFKAVGTLGKVITAQRSRFGTLIRSKPVPTDRHTLAQTYQRWLYEDYCYLWYQQSPATKAAYKALATQRKTTPIAEWLRYNLTNLPDIDAWYRLDEPSGSSPHDSSKHALTATATGTLVVPGIIDMARSFNGIADQVSCPQTYLPTGADPRTVDFFITRPTGAPVVFYPYPFAYGEKVAYHGFGLYMLDSTTDLYFYAHGYDVDTGVDLDDTLTHHIALTFDGTNLRTYKDGLLVSTIARPLLDTTLGALTLLLASFLAPGQYMPCTLDNFVVRNRVADSVEIARWSLRHHP